MAYGTGVVDRIFKKGGVVKGKGMKGAKPMKSGK